MKWLNWLVWLLTLIAIFIVCTNSITDSDFWWHLKTGEYIWQTKSVPHKDIFSHTAAGRVWTVHEWLAQVIIYLTYQLAGFNGDVYLTALMAVLTFGVIGLVLRAEQVPDLISQGVVFLGAVVGSPFFIPRPQIFYFLLWSALILVLTLYERGKKRAIWLIPLLFFAWANFHASIQLMVLLIGLYLFSQFSYSFFVFREELGRFLREHRNLIMATLIGVLAAMVNPNGYHVYTYIKGLPFLAKSTFEISEWGPLWAPWESLTMPSTWQAWFFIIFYFLVLLIFLIVFKKSRQKGIIQRAIVVFPLILAAFAVSKFLPLSLLIALPFLGMNLKEIFLGERKSWEVHPVISSGLVLIFLVLAVSYHCFLGRPIKPAWKDFPQKATEFVLENKIPGEMFNHYNQGGFLIWRLYPQYRTFVDGRSEMFEPDIIADFQTVGEGGESWEEPLVKYKVNFLFLPPKDVHPGLALSENWLMVYFDNYAAIYVKDAAENKEIIAKHGYRVIRPFLLTIHVEKGKEPEAIAEYQRSLELNSDNFKAHYDLGIIYINLEKYREAEEHFRKAIEIFPQSTRSHYNLGHCLEKQGKLEEAEKEYLEYQFLIK